MIFGFNLMNISQIGYSLYVTVLKFTKNVSFLLQIAILSIAIFFSFPQPLQAQQSVPPLFFPETPGDKISLFGNRLNSPTMYGFGAESNSIYYKSNNNHRWYNQRNADGGLSASMTLNSNGNLGIGTPSPNHELVVQGDDPVIQLRDDTADNSANAARLELLERAEGDFDDGAFLWWNGDSNKLLIGTKINGANKNVFVINSANSNVGIGTSSPSAADRLAVNGRIRAKEIVVETGWSDFVFNQDYLLRSLPEVEQYIQQHGHLPDIPTAAEVADQGVQLGEMESRLLQKVEELTLHLIEMHKRVRTLEQMNVTLQKELTSATAKQLTRGG